VTRAAHIFRCRPDGSGLERVPQRTTFGTGTHVRENRKGRTGAGPSIDQTISDAIAKTVKLPVPSPSLFQLRDHGAVVAEPARAVDGRWPSPEPPDLRLAQNPMGASRSVTVRSGTCR
jgi:hypothetical protein